MSVSAHTPQLIFITSISRDDAHHITLLWQQQPANHSSSVYLYHHHQHYCGTNIHTYILTFMQSERT